MSTDHVRPRSRAVVQFGELVRHARAQLGWAQTTLADAAGMEVTKISRIERGAQAHVHMDEILSLAAALEVPPAVLSGWARSDGRLTPAPTPERLDGATVIDLPSSTRPRVIGPRAVPGTTPPRVAGLTVIPRAVHAIICGHVPGKAVPEHASLRRCGGCGLAIESRLVRAEPNATGGGGSAPPSA